MNQMENQINIIKPIDFDEKKDEDSIFSNTKTTKDNNKEEENNKVKIENFGMTIGTVTSSEFREGCKGIDTFLLTIKKIQKDNGNEIKEKQINILNENYI